MIRRFDCEGGLTDNVTHIWQFGASAREHHVSPHKSLLGFKSIPVTRRLVSSGTKDEATMSLMI